MPFQKFLELNRHFANCKFIELFPDSVDLLKKTWFDVYRMYTIIRFMQSELNDLNLWKKKHCPEEVEQYEKSQENISLIGC